MPRAFTDAEREAIRERLTAAGRECFLRFGLKKTTIEDLVRPAGIAKASFYLFFESKEALFVEVYMREMPAMMDRLLDGSFRAAGDAREAFIRLMQGIVREIETDEMSRILLDDPAELQRLAGGVDYERILERSAAFFAPLIEEIAAAQARGEVIEGDPFQIVCTLGLVKLLPLNRDRVPPALYRAMLDLAPRVIADGLTCPARRGAERGAEGP